MSEDQAPERLAFPDMSDFKFTAAYNAYVKAFESADVPVKNELNELVKQLHDGKIDYGSFYSVINRYITGSEKGSTFRRARIEGQRKQEYQAGERKRGRNERYRG